MDLVPQVVLFSGASLALLGVLALAAVGMQALTGPVATEGRDATGGRRTNPLMAAARGPLAVLMLGLLTAAAGAALAEPDALRDGLEPVRRQWILGEAAVYLFLGGLALAFVGFLALVVAAFGQGWGWGLGVLIFPPLALVFLVRHARAALGPVLMIVLGLAILASPIAVAHFTPIDLGPHEEIVDGERHLTLTGWDRPPGQYGPVLYRNRDVVVLQMANPDVTDDTLRALDGLERLRELDLSGSRVTDAGLEPIARLPALETLRLRGTAVTDAGFRAHLAEKPSLKQLDLRGTGVAAGTIAEWRETGPGRRALR